MCTYAGSFKDSEADCTSCPEIWTAQVPSKSSELDWQSGPPARMEQMHHLRALLKESQWNSGELQVTQP